MSDDGDEARIGIQAAARGLTDGIERKGANLEVS
jgi:hypothetical protein